MRAASAAPSAARDDTHAEVLVDVAPGESRLPLVERLAEASVSLKDREQRHGDARAFGGSEDPSRHLGRIGVATAVRCVMDAMELRHRRVSGLEHLHLRQRRDRLEIVGIERVREPEQATPRRVRHRWLGTDLGVLLVTGERAQERLTVRVGHARDREAVHGLARLVAGTRRRHVADRHDPPALVDDQVAGRQPRVRVVEMIESKGVHGVSRDSATHRIRFGLSSVRSGGGTARPTSFACAGTPDARDCPSG